MHTFLASLRLAANALFPRHCLSCGRRGGDLCVACALALPRAEKAPSIAGYPAMALFEYRHPVVRELIAGIKYRSSRDAVRLVGRLLYEMAAEELAEQAAFGAFREAVIIPVPLSPRRARQRGFNQSELIAHAFAAGEGVGSPSPILAVRTDILRKVRETPPQVSCASRTERLANLAACFAVANPEAVYKKDIILIDDVLTTGATLTEAAKVLKKSGAKNVLCLVVGH